MSTLPMTDPEVSDGQVDAYRRDGFVRVPGMLSLEEAAFFHDAALSAAETMQKMEGARSAFDQCVNAWREDEAMRRLTLHRNLGAVAERLAGVRLRLWHDHVLIKRPKTSTATEFHQDQPYWPHADSANALSCWIALCDVPVERGCMTFIEGQQHRTDLTPQDLHSSTSLFEMAPEMAWERRVTVPLRAGDCTFHHGRCPHMATPNLTDDPRVAHVVIFVDASTRFTGGEHVVTDPLGLSAGDGLPDAMFPLVGGD